MSETLPLARCVGRMEWERNPYLKLFQESVSYVLERQAYLFSHEDVSWCHRILNQTSSLGQYFLARVLGREGRWHRLDKLMKCLPREVKNGNNSSCCRILEEAVEELQQAEILTKLNSKTSFEEVWIILSNCLTMDELKVLHERISKTKCKGFGFFFSSIPSLTLSPVTKRRS
jgi:hypothetical protein